MWSRADLKYHAKNVLRGHYWKAFLVSFILALVTGGSGGGGGGQGGVNYTYNVNDPVGGFDFAEVFPFLMIGFGIFIVVMIFAFAFKFFLANPLEVGGRKFFVRLRHGKSDLNALGMVFNRDHYMNVVKGMFRRDLFIFLWSLLLIIPGIIKSYAYRFVPYLLAENPDMEPARAMEISQAMTYGEKWRMFVLDLSFIGWYFLGMLAFVVGTFFVHPYYNATQAELYDYLKQVVISEGTTTEAEISGARHDDGRTDYNDYE